MLPPASHHRSGDRVQFEGPAGVEIFLHRHAHLTVGEPQHPAQFIPDLALPRTVPDNDARKTGRRYAKCLQSEIYRLVAHQAVALT